MMAHSFPQMRTFLLTIVVAFFGLILDLNLKTSALEFDFGSASHRWLNQAYISLADKLLSGTQQVSEDHSSAEPQQAGNRNAEPGPLQQGELMAVAAAPQIAAQSTTKKSKVCVAPAQAQFGQGNTLQADYGTPVRNALVLMMSGPAMEIASLDASVPVQLDAEARQKDCDYILMSSVTVKRAGSGGFGKLMKVGSMAASFTPMGMMAKGVGGMIAAQTASTAIQSAAMATQQQAVSQLSGFNGQIKSKDEVTVEYQLVATGQSQSRLQNVLKGKSKIDGEDVLSPLLREAANGVVNEVVKSER